MQDIREKISDLTISKESFLKQGSVNEPLTVSYCVIDTVN